MARRLYRISAPQRYDGGSAMIDRAILVDGSMDAHNTFTVAQRLRCMLCTDQVADTYVHTGPGQQTNDWSRFAHYLCLVYASVIVYGYVNMELEHGRSMYSRMRIACALRASWPSRVAGARRADRRFT